MFEGDDALLFEQRQQFDEDLRGDQRIAQGGVAAYHVDAQAGGDGLHAVVVPVRVGHGGEEEGVQHGVDEADAGLGLQELQQAHVEGGVVGHQHGLLGEAVELGQHPVDGGLAVEHGLGDARDGDRGRRDRALGVHQLVEDLLAQQPSVDDAHGAEGDDGVPLGDVETGGFAVEDREGEGGEGALVQFRALAGLVEEVEIVIFRAAGRGGGGQDDGGFGLAHGQEEA